MPEPRLIVYSSLFPSRVQPAAGIFIRERMFRVGRHIPIVVVSPQPWSPFDWLVRRFRSSFRPVLPKFEQMDGVDVHRPRWLSLPGIGKRFDGWSMALCTMRPVRRIRSEFGATVIDAHFLYPDGWAATWIARRLGLPVTVTIRGSKDEWLIGTERERGLREALARATRIFAVSQALARNVAHALGAPAEKVTVIGNGVDSERFQPVDRAEARRRLDLAPDAPVLIGVGNLVPSKGFQHVIAQLPRLCRRHPGLVYLIVGAGAAHADLRASLEAQAAALGVRQAVRFCGRQPQEELRWFYGAADIFVLATEFEGWANVFLEAMACGLPVISTRVGGNAEVVQEPETGELVAFGDGDALADAIERALGRDWDRQAIIAYARANSWESRVEVLLREFRALGAGEAPVSSESSTTRSAAHRSVDLA